MSDVGLSREDDGVWRSNRSTGCQRSVTNWGAGSVHTAPGDLPLLARYWVARVSPDLLRVDRV